MSDEMFHAPLLPHAIASDRSRSALLLVWLVPVVALLIGGWLAIKAVLEQGPTITIAFKQAEGLEAGKTRLKFKDVDVGLVKSIDLSKDLKQVIVTAELKKDFKPHLVEDTSFWVVRARISGGNVYGLGTLLSGSHISVDAGRSEKSQRHFTGLEVPPVVQIDSPGREYSLRSPDLGSLDVGSPILFRRLQVGQIKSHALSNDGKTLLFKVFIHAPYDKFVTANTRFWNASGVDLTLDAEGVKLNTQSVVSILLGGVAFEDPSDHGNWPVAGEAHEFSLFASRATAMKNSESRVFRLSMSFHESVRGLSPGAPVDFRGIEVGEVVALHAEVDPVSKQTFILVDTDLYPERMRSLMRGNQKEVANSPAQLDMLVSKGLRARLETGNLLTGQLYVTLDFVPNAPPAKVAWSRTPPVLPTVPSNLQNLQQTIVRIAQKLDSLPFEKIGNGLNQTLVSANSLMKRLDDELAPEAVQLLQETRLTLRGMETLLASDAPLQLESREAIRELTKAAKAFRGLADYLERHPEALLRGKTEDPK